MKLFRFMSFEEFKKYCDGELLINNTNHNKDNNQMTNSIGFCFFNYAQHKPEEILHSVFGIATCNICAIFETDRKNVRRTHGRYSQPIDRDTTKRRTIVAHEYCTTEYDNKSFKLISWSIPEWSNWDKWDWNRKE